MPLHLSLRPGERIIINGCVIRNGPRRHMFEVENRADILRGDEMLEEATATTPARRIAYQLQIALVSAELRDSYLPVIAEGLEGLARALPRFERKIAGVEALVAERNFYAAFRALAPIFAHEDRLLAHFPQGSQT